MFQQIAKFPKPVWVLIGVAFIRVVAYFTAIPFLAIILATKFGLATAEIGLIIGIASAVGIIISILFGNLADQYGRRKALLGGFAAMTISMAFIGFATQIPTIIIGIIILNIGHGLMNSRALMTDYVRDDRAMRDLVLQTSYFTVNVAVVIGPLIGLQLAAGDQLGFVYLIGVYFAVFLFLAYRFHQEADHVANLNPNDENASFWHAFNVVKSDRVFLYFVFLVFTISLVFAQLEVTLILDISLIFDQLGGLYDSPAQIYAELISLTGFTVVVSVVPMTKLVQNLSMFNRSLVGSGIFTFGFILVACAHIMPFGYFYNLAIALVIITIGEVVMFPTFAIIQDRMAPEHLKGSYLGVAGLSEFGYALAPAVGGFLLQYGGSETLWLCMAALCVFVAVNFWWLKQHSAV